MFKRVKEVFIHHIRFFVACIAFFYLFQEAFTLVNRVIKLGKAVAHFASVNVTFKTVGNFRIIRIALGERRNFFRMTGNKYRLNKFIFNIFVKAGVNNFAHAKSRLVFHMDSISHFARGFHIGYAFKVLPGVFCYCFNHAEARPGRSQVNFLSFVGYFHGAQNLLRNFGNNFFR